MVKAGVSSQINDRKAKVTDDRISQPNWESSERSQIGADEETTDDNVNYRHGPTWWKSDEKHPGEDKYHDSQNKWHGVG
jgi:hypothetical protein